MGAGDSGLTEGVSELLLRSRSPAGGLGGLYAVTRKSQTVPMRAPDGTTPRARPQAVSARTV